MAIDTAAGRPRALRLQFSLRLLFFAFTGFAIGFPIWYRWPYEEVVLESPAGSPNPVRQITTWQRQWGGSRLKHGPERAVIDGKTVRVTSFRNGQKDGPYLDWSIGAENMQAIELLPPSGPVTFGQYVNGQKHGNWTGYRNGQKQFETYDHGKQVSP